MSHKAQYFLFILVLHGIIAGLLFYVLRENKWYFILSEVGILASIFLSYKLHQNFIRPIELMQTGVDAIKDEDFSVKFIRKGTEGIKELITVFNNMLDRLKAERIRTQEQGYFLESIIEASPIGMVIMDYDDQITDINPAASNMLKITMEDDNNYKPSDYTLIRNILNIPLGQSRIIVPDIHNKYKCQVNSIVHRGFHRKFIMIEELSKELLESEKEAYGKVIRMMAHEVNNSMGAVNSILQSVIEFGFIGNTDNDIVESLVIAKQRNEELADFMKNFADVIRLPPPHFSQADIKDLIQQTVRVMQPLAKDANVEITSAASSESIVINCDAGQIQQVMINAIKNSLESIVSNGHIHITAKATAPNIVITDDGPGISPDIKNKLFSPFFSTKQSGQGIGLIVSRDILLSHGATFRLYTEEAKGKTHFEISFDCNVPS